MRKFIFVLLTLLLVSPFSFAMKGIIWQPQNRDSQVTDTQWQGLMSQLRFQGFDTWFCNGPVTAMHLPSQNSARYCLSVPQLRNRLA